MHYILIFIVSLIFLSSRPANATPPAWNTNSHLTRAKPAQHSCGFFRCPRNAAYELALEHEFWGLVQRDDQDGMKAWLEKAQSYTDHRSNAGRVKQTGRLWMLVAAGHTMRFNAYDLHRLVPTVNALTQGAVLQFMSGIGGNFSNTPALGHLVQALRYSMKASRALPDHANAHTFLLGIGGFAQASLPRAAGLTGIDATIATYYGPSCDNLASPLRALFGELCTERGLMGPGADAHSLCTDAESCKAVGTGTEGLIAGALAMAMMRDPRHIEAMLGMLGDGPADSQMATCDVYWCHFNNPNDPDAEFPEATSIAPFKRIAVQLSIAEAYAKVGATKKMERALAKTYVEARRLNYPFMQRIRDVDASLHGGDQRRGIEDLRQAWDKPEATRDFMGEVQFPLPLSSRSGACASCHFAGVMNQTVRY